MIPSGTQLIIGIDVGTTTGFAVYNRTTKQLEKVFSDFIHNVMDKVRYYHANYKIFVRVEDPRKLYTWNKDAKRFEGIGSVKRDARIFEDFLRDLKIPFEMVRPNRELTKWDAAKFKLVTRWTEKTDSHGRDAALICYQR